MSVLGTWRLTLWEEVIGGDGRRPQVLSRVCRLRFFPWVINTSFSPAGAQGDMCY